MCTSLPDFCIRAFNALGAGIEAGLGREQRVKPAAKELGLPEGADTEDVLNAICVAGTTPVKAIATILINSGVPIMSLAADMPTKVDVQAVGYYVTGATWGSERFMAEDFMQAALAEWEHLKAQVDACKDERDAR